MEINKEIASFPTLVNMKLLILIIQMFSSKNLKNSDNVINIFILYFIQHLNTIYEFFLNEDVCEICYWN